jgi:hypothetical protein
LYTGIASLKINDANLDDAGKYEVKAENPVGKDETDSQLLVGHTAVLDETPNIHPDDFKNMRNKSTNNPLYVPPKFITPLENVKIDEGEDLVFLCIVDGYPKPKVLN